MRQLGVNSELSAFALPAMEYKTEVQNQGHMTDLGKSMAGIFPCK